MSFAVSSQEMSAPAGSTSRPADDPHAVVSIRPTDYLRRKRVFDRLAGLVLLIPGLPIIGFLVLLVRMTSPGAGIYKQKRVGKNGRVYTMYKIRTMRSDAECKSGAVWAVAKDPRITRLGRVLRKLHVDEFPQLFNVVRGEMSLVGPRPERPEFTTDLAREIPEYLDRLSMKPGVTGLAQIILPPDTDLDSVRRKLRYDLAYIERANLYLDLRILVSTFFRIFAISGDYTARLLGLDRLVRPSAEERREAARRKEKKARRKQARVVRA
jgi:lipopolysaccharide/colanic/teichoic acid biosynthesis glycosyltransferase